MARDLSAGTGGGRRQAGYEVGPGSVGQHDAPLEPGLHDENLAGAHELAERLTALSNYLAAALRLCDIGAPSPNQKTILEKASAQAELAIALIRPFLRSY
jgi:hypothetical protein